MKTYPMPTPFQFEVLTTLDGFGSASGICFENGRLYFISDSSMLLYCWDFKGEVIEIPFVPGGNEGMLKKDKPDVESITRRGDTLYIFGSGSTFKRNRLFLHDLKTGTTSEKDITNVYDKMCLHIGMDRLELNIEGTVFYNNQFYFFQRGNGRDGINGVFVTDENMSVRSFTNIKLPDIAGVPATFTDAIAVNGQFWILGSAEESLSTYDDGEVRGSLIGVMDIDTLAIVRTYIITDCHKLEGICLYNENPESYTFLICEDDDLEGDVSPLYKLTLKK